jgi:hypothetical protein
VRETLRRVHNGRKAIKEEMIGIWWNQMERRRTVPLQTHLKMNETLNPEGNKAENKAQITEIQIQNQIFIRGSG